MDPNKDVAVSKVDFFGGHSNIMKSWIRYCEYQQGRVKKMRSSETEKADQPQPIKEIQRKDPIEASSVWGIACLVGN